MASGMPCECGSPDASWHGPEGLQEYMCDDCWSKAPPRTSMMPRTIADAMDLMQLGEELIQPLGTRTIGGQPLTPRDWAAIALAALDQAGADRQSQASLRKWVRQFLGIE